VLTMYFYIHISNTMPGIRKIHVGKHINSYRTRMNTILMGKIPMRFRLVFIVCINFVQ
jgi:hypothetical protein